MSSLARPRDPRPVLGNRTPSKSRTAQLTACRGEAELSAPGRMTQWPLPGGKGLLKPLVTTSPRDAMISGESCSSSDRDAWPPDMHSCLPSKPTHKPAALAHGCQGQKLAHTTRPPHSGTPRQCVNMRHRNGRTCGHSRRSTFLPRPPCRQYSLLLFAGPCPISHDPEGHTHPRDHSLLKKRTYTCAARSAAPCRSPLLPSFTATPSGTSVQQRFSLSSCQRVKPTQSMTCSSRLERERHWCDRQEKWL